MCVMELLDNMHKTWQMLHFKTSNNAHNRGLTKTDVNNKDTWANPFQHSVWTQDEVDSVRVTHREVQSISDKIAYNAVQLARWLALSCTPAPQRRAPAHLPSMLIRTPPAVGRYFDKLSGYNPHKLTKEIVLNRAIFLETVAGCPGMAGGMMRHLSSLRNMRRDHGWIHTLLEEAENERMHLLTFVQIKRPGPFFRAAVVSAQGVFMTAFVATYLVNPSICHRFVGYLEEEAVHTYSDIIKAIDSGMLADWQTELAPPIAVDYWHLRPGATMRDLMLAVRADEANHREVNHTFANLGLDDINPYVIERQKELQLTRDKILEQSAENKTFVREVLRRWDQDKTGSLEFEELRAWLSSISANRQISDLEVKWVMSMAAHSKLEDYTKLSLTPDLFVPAAEAFMAYNASKPTIDKLFDEFDESKSGFVRARKYTRECKALNLR
jgi:ubiquinol oxidase